MERRNENEKRKDAATTKEKKANQPHTKDNAWPICTCRESGLIAVVMSEPVK